VSACDSSNAARASDDQAPNNQTEADAKATRQAGETDLDGAVGALDAATQAGSGSPNASTQASSGIRVGDAGTSSAREAQDQIPAVELLPDEALSSVSYFGAGERLSPVLLSVEAGVGTVTRQWFDAELSAACSYNMGADGRWHCLPSIAGNVYYTDADCSEAVGWASEVPTCESAQELVSSTSQFVYELGECGAEMYRLTEQVDIPAQVYRLSGDTCSSVETATMPSGAVLRQAEHMPAQSFVTRQLVVESDERSPGMRARRWVGEDGSWELESFYDEARDEPCNPISPPNPPGVPAGACIPHPFINAVLHAQGGPYYDAQCTRLGALQSLGGQVGCDPNEPPRALYVWSDSPDGCPPLPWAALFEASELQEQPIPYAEDEAGNCVVWEREPHPAYVATEEIAFDSLAILDRVLVGTGRIKVAFLAHEGVPYMPDGSYFDSVAEEPCRPTLFSDGTYRCVSSAWQAAGSVSILWADPECSDAPLISVARSPSECLPDELEMRGARVYEPDPDCDDRVAGVATVEPFEGDSFYQGRLGGPCKPADPAVLDLYELYSVGGSLDADEVLGRIEVELP
jgi:hypothetical protein